MQLVLLQTIELVTVAHNLQKVSHLVDWEKLHDEYLIALYSEDPTGSSHRQLKSRAARPRRKGQRKKKWNVASLEENLEKEAMHAIEEAKGFAAPTLDEKEGRDFAERSPNSPSTIAPVASHAPVDRISTAAGTGGDSAADGDEFPIIANNSSGGTVVAAQQRARASDQQGYDESFNGKPIPVHVPSKGNCPDAGNVAVIPIPCAPDNLKQICNKYDPAGSFRACFEACRPSFCCIHGK